MAEAKVNLTVRTLWYVAPLFAIAGFVIKLAATGIKVEVK